MPLPRFCETCEDKLLLSWAESCDERSEASWVESEYDIFWMRFLLSFVVVLLEIADALAE